MRTCTCLYLRADRTNTDYVNVFSFTYLGNVNPKLTLNNGDEASEGMATTGGVIVLLYVMEAWDAGP